MRIAFLCGSLEPGRDGVGDYTRGLAEELQRQGHSVIIIALRDRFITQPVVGDGETSDDSIKILRLPSEFAWMAGIQQAKFAIDQFDPEWVSLQFVCYTFHPKGFVYGLASKLGPLMTGRKVHIMFHETWLCRELGWDWQHGVIGMLQRFLLQRFVRAVRPAVIHTSNRAYVTLLTRSGIPATELGLFGNIAIVSEPGTAWIESQLRAALGADFRREELWLFGLFGTLHPQWPTEPLLTQLQRAASASGKRPVILSIGRIGMEGAALWKEMARVNVERFAFVCLGEQPEAHISEFLSYLDWGIATSPWSIIGKSGTVVAMLEHGLPVIVNRCDTPSPAGPSEGADTLLIAGDSQLESRLRAGLGKGPRGSRSPLVARKFLLSLQRGSPSSATTSSLARRVS